MNSKLYIQKKTVKNKRDHEDTHTSFTQIARLGSQSAPTLNDQSWPLLYYHRVYLAFESIDNKFEEVWNPTMYRLLRCFTNFFSALYIPSTHTRVVQLSEIPNYEEIMPDFTKTKQQNEYLHLLKCLVRFSIWLVIENRTVPINNIETLHLVDT